MRRHRLVDLAGLAFFVEDLPKSPVGKVLKKELRLRFGVGSSGPA